MVERWRVASLCLCWPQGISQFCKIPPFQQAHMYRYPFHSIQLIRSFYISNSSSIAFFLILIWLFLLQPRVILQYTYGNYHPKTNPNSSNNNKPNQASNRRTIIEGHGLLYYQTESTALEKERREKRYQPPT